MEEFTGYMIPIVGGLCYGAVELLKPFVRGSHASDLYPIVAAFLGAVLMVGIYFAEPTMRISESILETVLIGMCSGLAATGGNQMAKKMLTWHRSTQTE